MSWSKVKHSNVIHCLNAEGTQHYAMYLYTDIKIKYFATKIDARNNKAHTHVWVYSKHQRYCFTAFVYAAL